MLSPLFALFSVLLLGLSYLTNAAPTRRAELLAYGPEIIVPTYGAIWKLDSDELVEWDTKDIPAEARGYHIQVLLGRPDSTSEHLNTSYPLADDVPIMQGSVTVRVPSSTPTGGGYVVALIGVSDDLSPEFTVIA